MNSYQRYGEYLEREPGHAAAMIASLLIGVGVGALISLLFAPKSGHETRDFLRRQYDNAKRGISEQSGSLRRRGAGIVDATRKITPFARRQEQA
jgi:gas vesicle protein